MINNHKPCPECLTHSKFKRPTTMYPDTYTPRRTKAIGPHLLKRADNG